VYRERRVSTELTASSSQAIPHYTVCEGRIKELLEEMALSRARNLDPLSEEGTPPKKRLILGQKGLLGRLSVGRNRDLLTIQRDYRIVTKSVRMKNTGGLLDNPARADSPGRGTGTRLSSTG